MAKNNNLTDFLTDVANSIRKKTGGSAKINPQNFSSAIESIKTAPNLRTPEAVTPNDETQIVTPGSGYDGLAQVTVNPVPTEEPTVTAGTQATTVTPSSGKYLKKVTVNPTPSESKSIPPTTSRQTVTPSSGKLLSQVIVDAIQTETKDVTPGASSKSVTPSTGKFLSQVTVDGDSNLVPANIVAGKSIFGVRGTASAISPTVSYLMKTQQIAFSSMSIPDEVKIAVDNNIHDAIYQTTWTFAGKTLILAGGDIGTLTIVRTGASAYTCYINSGWYSQNSTSFTTSDTPSLVFTGISAGGNSSYSVEVRYAAASAIKV